jgi:hypothetical protein
MRRKLLWAAALLYSLAHFALTGLRQPLGNFYGDFLATFPARRLALLAGRLDLWSGTLAQRWTHMFPWGHADIWYYGPLHHLIAAPMLAFPTLRSGYIAWLFVNLLFVGATMAIAAKIADDVLAVVVMFLNFNPLYEAITQRNIEIFELMLLFAAYALYRRGRDSACGAAIGAAAMAKFLPIIYLPWLVLKRRWRALGAAIAVIVPLTIAAQPILGWQNSGTLLQTKHGGFIDSDLDQSLSGVIVRLVGLSHAAIASRVAIAVALIAFCALMLRLRNRQGVEDLEFGLIAMAMVLLPPHNQNYYFSFLLLPYAFLYARYRCEKWSWRTTLCAVSFVLVAAPVPFSILQRLTGLDAFTLYLRAAIPFIGATLLVIVLVAEIGMSNAVLTAEQPCPSKKPSRISALS